MSLTQEQIEKLSKNLSKIRIDNEKLAQDVDLLNEVDTTGVKCTTSVIESESILREDIEKREVEPKDLLACSKQKVIANQIAISNIMK